MLLRRFASRHLGYRQLRPASRPWRRLNSTDERASDPFAKLAAESEARKVAQQPDTPSGAGENPRGTFVSSAAASGSSVQLRKDELVERFVVGPGSRASFKCQSCGATYPYRHRLEQHVSRMRSSGLLGKGCRKAQVMQNVDTFNKVGEVVSVEPSDELVTYTSGYEVLGSWTAVAEGGGFSIKAPGILPVWSPPQLPFSVEPRISISFPTHLDLQLQAVRATKPDFRFDNVDVITKSSVLAQLLSHLTKRQTSRILVMMINDTLIMGESLKTEVPSGSPPSASERQSPKKLHHKLPLLEACTRSPPGSDGGVLNTRLISYKFGNLTCAVHGGVDAVCEPLAFQSTISSTPRDPGKVDNVSLAVVGKEATEPLAIENANFRRKQLRSRLERAWFLRNEVLFEATLERDTHQCRELIRYDGATVCAEYEDRPLDQTGLRKLASLLSQLRRVLKSGAQNGQLCVAVLSPVHSEPLLTVYPTLGEPAPFSDMVKQSWSGLT